MSAEKNYLRWKQRQPDLRNLTKILAFSSLVVLLYTIVGFQSQQPNTSDQFVTYIANPSTQDVQLYWKDEKGQVLNSLQNLKTHLEKKGRKLSFAMNGGMYMTDFSPLGLFIQNKTVVKKLNRAEASGNFYLKPNGVFFISTKQKAFVCTTEQFKNNGDVLFATQSGPMLVIDGSIHPAFKEGSSNLNIRNGVGILPDQRIVFAMSKTPVNFYDFAAYFKSLGCRNALYLDGFVSRAYAPDKNWLQLDGNFGVMIGVTEKSSK